MSFFEAKSFGMKPLKFINEVGEQTVACRRCGSELIPSIERCCSACGQMVDWKEFNQSVTWQEAILEFAKGKKVTAKFNGQEWSLVELIELPEYLNRAIANGKWYVED